VVEDREPILIADDAFAIEQDGVDLELADSLRDAREALAPIDAGMGVDAHVIAGLPSAMTSQLSVPTPVTPRADRSRLGYEPRRLSVDAGVG
jgi:hypothetical protein